LTAAQTAVLVEHLMAALERLRAWIERAQASLPDPTDAWLQARLAPDMLPFEQQVQVAVNMTLRTAFPVCGEPVPDFGEFAADVQGLMQRIDHALRMLSGLSARLSAGTRLPDEISFVAGQARHTLPPARFVISFAMPNLHFHLSMAYALLRQHGVPLGKADYDGWHAYPAPP
jgi:hypothetical protein